MQKLSAILLATLALPALAHAEDKASVWEQEKRDLKPGEGLYVVDTTLAVDVSRTRDDHGKDVGWSPSRLAFSLWGKTDSSDKLVVTWLDGKKALGKTECPLRDIDEKVDYAGRYGDQQEIHCDVKEGSIVYAKPGVASATIALRSTETQKETTLRTIRFDVVKYADGPGKKPDPGFYVDRDYRLAENFAYWLANNGKGTSDAALTVRTWTKQDDDVKSDGGKLKCTVDGAAVESDSYTASQNSFTVEPYIAGKQKKIVWAEVTGTLYAKRDDAAYKPGKWECKLLVDGKLLRTFRFELDKNLAVIAGDEQAKQPGAIAGKSVYLRDVTMPANADIAYDKKAIADLAFMGRPWFKKP
jgi:hypothetical protein